MTILRRLGTLAGIAGLAAVGVTALPHDANAWWRGRYGFGVWVPPVAVSRPPPVVYTPPPGHYPRAHRVWIPPHWDGPYWIRGHWA